MRLDEEAEAMRRGELGRARQWAIEHQVRVGRYFGANDLVSVTQAHIMADTESLGEAGVAWLEHLAALPKAERRVRIPTITDPRGTDFGAAQRLRQQAWMTTLEQRAITAFEELGVLMTNTCINYQTIMPPIPGEHVAYGDTGVVIYCNSVLGARSNFEGGPSALAAGLTGRTPRYGYHLDAQRRGTLLVELAWTPGALHEWGALGGVVGRLAGDYWRVPVITGLSRIPGSDEVKHFGAAMASFGSIAMFHLAGVTPEARRLEDAFDGTPPKPVLVTEQDVRTLLSGYGTDTDTVDVVVFSAPQLSLMEMQSLADLLDGRRVGVPLLAVTSPQVKPDADRMGITARIEASGAMVLTGMCFYQSYARELAEANGWKRLATNSAKLTNILGGYGYRPVLLSAEHCVEVACGGKQS
ncbi:MAG TPA: aconitase X catalytic domain-containing protein [Rhodopila sp.]|uniref:aconitase X catalytic domain-containing protein n=1 Tax=Rhodopila sp. TaxID=2480087 RepID=UPI002CFB3590|nr:aconitase X catalytic domain-containing protein [Rhodopila sp.]HVY13798.1 aconitase X catalytic domain-containing protein [Rhodopila sp.]